tara:strand:- start:527 stop:925 length:399 start_codon:yes stop_codon:yes gene_type:complete
MEKQFIPYKEALVLKELGFNVLCPTKYGMTSLKLYDNWKPFKNSDDLYDDKHFCNDMVAAPLYQQAFRWFREKHDLYSNVYVMPSDHWNISVNKGRKKTSNIYDDITIGTHEEAELACLKKLIEIVKNKESV